MPRPSSIPCLRFPNSGDGFFALNPMSAVVEIFRYAFLGAGFVKPLYLLISLGVTLVVLGVGIVVFRRIEKTFMDTV